MNHLLVVAPLGPVVTGRSVVSRFVADALRDDGVPVMEVNVGPRSRNPAARLLRPGAFLTAIATLASARRRIGAVYLAVDAGAGMWLTTMVVAVARLVGVRVVLHHHAYGYLEHRRARAACLLAVAGRHAVNIVNCASMSQLLSRRYGNRTPRALVLSNVVTVQAERRRRGDGDRAVEREVVIGFLSNLTFAKGLADAIGTGIAVAQRLPGSHLVVAGPCADRAARSYLRDALRRHPGRIRYVGPVTDRQKAAFFASIDLFAFPSLYENETQGIVNFEALAHGVPIVAREVGCIGEDFSDAPGLVVARSDDFVRSASDAIVRLVEGGRLRDLQRTARTHFEGQRQRAQTQLDRVVATIGDLTDRRPE